MSPDQAALLVPISILCIIFASFFINIRLAKKQIPEWKRGTAYWFVRSNGLGGVRRRADLVWKKILGYNDAEAQILAKYQSRAIFFAFFGGIFLMTILINWVER
jgi:hypothetical protein